VTAKAVTQPEAPSDGIHSIAANAIFE